ncbi:MAG TPA: HYExAFE family protein [Phycisphaerales bacterium]|nr:HYExAFE family protein [Phycisphaerales bacterium]
MAQRRFHYEKAFEHYLRANRVPYVAVDEARKALMPHDDVMKGDDPLSGSEGGVSLKSFDFVVYASTGSLLVDVKGRLFGSRKLDPCSFTRRRMENWVTQDDVSSMKHWERLFGEGFTGTFVFVYALAQQPPDALFEEIFEFDSRWYALRSIALASYVRHMTVRSQSWRTVQMPADAFGALSSSFSVRNGRGGAPREARCGTTGAPC